MRITEFTDQLAHYGSAFVPLGPHEDTFRQASREMDAVLDDEHVRDGLPFQLSRISFCTQTIDELGHTHQHLVRKPLGTPLRQHVQFAVQFNGSDNDSLLPPAARRVQRLLDCLGARIFEAIKPRLDLTRPPFQDDASSMYQIRYYASNDAGNQRRVPPHSDPSLFTFLSTSGTEALWVRRDGHYVRAPNNTLIVQAGARLEYLTHGTIQKCVHKVVLPRDSAKQTTAYYFSPPLQDLLRMSPESAPRRVLPVGL